MHCACNTAAFFRFAAETSHDTLQIGGAGGAILSASPKRPLQLAALGVFGRRIESFFAVFEVSTSLRIETRLSDMMWSLQKWCENARMIGRQSCVERVHSDGTILRAIAVAPMGMTHAPGPETQLSASRSPAVCATANMTVAFGTPDPRCEWGNDRRMLHVP
jgi:hypothetical protein